MKKGLIALSPLGVFIAFYLVTSIIAGDFYKIPITVAFMVSSIYAIIIFGGKPLMSRVNTYSRGAATEQMMLMIWIFVLAGAFASSAKAMGSIDATVNLTLSLLFHLPVHRYQRRYHRCADTYCSWYSDGDRHRRSPYDSNHRRWFLLWRQPVVHLRHHYHGHTDTGMPAAR